MRVAVDALPLLHLICRVTLKQRGHFQSLPLLSGERSAHTVNDCSLTVNLHMTSNVTDVSLFLTHTHTYTRPQMSVIFYGANICVLTSPCTGPLSSVYALTHSHRHGRKHAKSTPKIAHAAHICSCAHQVLVRTGQSLWDCSAVVVAHCDRWRLVGLCVCLCAYLEQRQVFSWGVSVCCATLPSAGATCTAALVKVLFCVARTAPGGVFMEHGPLGSMQTNNGGDKQPYLAKMNYRRAEELKM